MNLSISFLVSKLLAKGEPRIKGIPLYTIFRQGKLVGIYEDLDEAKETMKFKDKIIKYQAHSRIELEYTTTELG